MEKIRVFEAFAGIGAQHEGWARLANDFPDEVVFEFVAMSEIDEWATISYRAAHGDVPNYGDITKIDWDKVPDFDMFTYSSPCQDFSNAGKQAGGVEGSGTRSSLLWECRRAIIAKRPKYLLFENVKAVTQKKFMPLFQKWIDELASYGYANFWQVLNSKNYGTAQNRERVFMVSILRTEADPRPRYNFPAPFPLTKCVEDYMLPAEEIGDEYFIDQTRVTDKVLSDILDQPNVRAEMEKFYHEEWSKASGD